MHKTCRDCGVEFPATRTYFYMSGGRLVNYCKSCYRTRYNRTNGTRRGTTATTTATSRGRYFGVELELTGPSQQIIMNALRAANLAAGVNYVGRYTATNGTTWELKSDGSVNGYGLELVSPKLRGAAGFAEIAKVCEALNSVGATVNRSCGLHVHHDMRGQSVEQIRTQVTAFVERQSLIWNLVAPSRRSNATYCPEWNAYQVSQLQAARDLASIGRIGPRGNINLHAYPRHGSVEVRAHAGTTNSKKIAAWVRFGQALFAAAEAGAQVSGTDVTQMLTDLTPFGLTLEDASWLLRFETAGQTRAAVAARLVALQDEMNIARSVEEEV